MPQSTIRIGSLNARTLKSDARVAELEDSVSDVPFDFIALQELRRTGQTSITLTKTGHLLVGYGTRAAYGTGFLVNCHWAPHALFHSINERLSYLDIPPLGLRVVSVYAPTTSHPDQDYEEILNDLAVLVSSSTNRVLLPGGGRGHVVICGDFNAKVGSRLNDSELFIGNHGLGVRNDRGQALYDFCAEMELFIHNTRFQKRTTRKWTWMSPNMDTKNQIDYILSRSNSNIQDVSIVGKLRFASDHRLIMSKIKISKELKQLYYQPRAAMMFDKRTFTAKIHATNMGTTSYEAISRKMQDVGRDSLLPRPKTERFSMATKDLFAKRKRLADSARTAQQKIEYSLTSKALRVSIHEDLRKKHLEVVRDAVRYGRSTRRALQSSEIGRTQINQLKRLDGTVACSRDAMCKVVQTFYNELYRRTIHPSRQCFRSADPFLKILPSEVHLSIMRLKSDKSPGPDRVTAAGESEALGKRSIDSVNS